MAKRVRAARHYQRDDDPVLRLSRSAMRGVARELQHAFNNLSSMVPVKSVADAIRNGRNPAGLINWHHYREVLRGAFDRLGKLRHSGGALGARKINGAFAAKRRKVRFRKAGYKHFVTEGAVLSAAKFAATRKASKAEAGYEERSSHGATCSGCWMFQAVWQCCAVEGVINPNGWCTYFETVFAKAYNPDEPRDERGRWTDGGDESEGLEGMIGQTVSVGEQTVYRAAPDGLTGAQAFGGTGGSFVFTSRRDAMEFARTGGGRIYTATLAAHEQGIVSDVDIELFGARSFGANDPRVFGNAGDTGLYPAQTQLYVRDKSLLRGFGRIGKAYNPDEPRDERGRWTTGGGEVSRAEKWARQGDEKGLTSIFDPSTDGDPTVYHGLKAGQERSGFLFVTRSEAGAAFHGETQAFKIRPGARIYADIETSMRRTGAQTLLRAREGNSSGIIHISDLIPLHSHRKAFVKATGDQFNFDSFSPAVQAEVRAEQDRLIQQLEADARDTIDAIISSGIADGTSVDDIAANIAENIGLTETQWNAVDNYRNMLEELDPDSLVRRLRNTEYDAIVQDSIDAQTDLSEAAIENMVSDYIENYIDYRAATIAQTESTRAANLGLHDAYDQAIERGALTDDAVTRFWQLGDNPCPVCESIVDNNPDGVGVNESFDSIEGPIDDPPVHPNCECSVDYVTDLNQVPDDGEEDRFGGGPGSFGVGGVDTPYMDDGGEE